MTTRSTIDPISSGSDMAATVRAGTRQGDNQRRDPVTEAFRFARGIKRPETARQRLLRLPAEIAAAVVAHRVHATPERCERFVAPIKGALTITTAPSLTPELQIRAQAADGNEELAQLAYQLNPCTETAIALVRAIDGESARQGLVRAAIVTKHGLAL